ncbi:hypothetical protein I9W82_001655 [Candida metapsilosis]|uniref:Formamidopyrimidine-DNA glycosylase catalytic domain-containing protein n=1 Tax=Candida metapsilosis TaxID=273372 RepID=A0A8H7ZHQ4_9ASCO|nr:hypothetical protein I9W82_001655 [Candida metapsilosis]
MPEVAEVAHVCALLRRNVLGFTIKSVNFRLDPLLFPVLKESKDPDAELEKMRSEILNSQIDSVGRHGKYFWLRLIKEGPKQMVLLMHFGMTGMIKIRDVKSHLVFMENGGDKKILKELNEPKGEDEIKVESDSEWPPRFSKFEMELVKDGLKREISFADPRRLGRVRLITDVAAATNDGLLQIPPLNALGPDYSKKSEVVKMEANFVFGDPDPNNHGRPRLDLNAFNKLILSKRKPIKSLLLDQTYFAGVGNWVADEVLFHAKLHPNEVVANKIAYESGKVNPVVARLYESLIYVCEEAVKCEGDSKKFPSHWLMLHRWGKARKKEGKAKTKDGLVLDHITVGGRTSCYAPEVQHLLKNEIVSEAKQPSRKRKPVENAVEPVKRRGKKKV